MIKLRYFILTLLLILICGSQSEAKEIKPLFGMYKIIYNEADDLLTQSWTSINMNDDAAKLYPKLFKSINEYDRNLHDSAIKRQLKYHEEAQSLKQEMPDNFRSFYDRNDIIVRRADSVVLSLLEMTEDYMGGVHGMYGYFGVNFDTATGKRLNISDVCNNAEVLIKAIMTRLHEDSPQSPFEGAEEHITQQVIEDKLNFTIDPHGISVYFNPYEIGCYAEGLFMATLLFDEYPDLFKDKYRQLPESYCQTLTRYDSNIVSFKNGMRNYIQLHIDDDGYYKVSCDGNIVGDKIGLQGVQPPILVHMDNGKNYLYIDGYVENRGRFLHVYQVGNNSIKLDWILPYTFKNIGPLKYETWWLITNPNDIRFDSNEPLGANEDLTSHFGGINANGSISFG